GFKVEMEPKKAVATRVKEKKKVVEEEEEMAPESNFSKMQYPKGVIVGHEWDSHIRKRKVSEYNHHTIENKKEIDPLMNTKANKHMVEDMP
ncbi:hypothetical protein KI387_018490, partial [Taxus chinensis]